MNRTLLAGTALLATFALPAIAEAASGFATANVNMRSGPSTAYPAVTLIPIGQPLTINGCLSETPWCDVSFIGGRGWVAGKYVQAVYQQRRVYVGPEYYRPLGIPTVTFDLDNYWDRNYRGRDFYRDRDRWAQGPDWDRNDPNWNRRPHPPRGPIYGGPDDGDQGNPPRRGNWPRQPGYNNGYDDSFQGDDNAPRPPRYRRPYNDNGQQFDDNPPRQGDFRGDNNPPRMPRQQGQDQQDQGQPRRQPQGQMQPPPQDQPPRQQPQDQQQQQRPPQPAPQQQIQPPPQPAQPPRQQSNDGAPRPANNQPPRDAGRNHDNAPNATGQGNKALDCGNSPNCGPNARFSHN